MANPASRKEKPAALERADGAVFRVILEAATRALETNRDAINALNVFPVPDGDTGTNMLLTMRAVLQDTAKTPADPLADAARAIARAALLGARGNSGLILAQFFKGISSGIGDAQSLGAAEFARGLRTASQNAYASVPNPKEGTMLTVFQECADCAEKAAASGKSLTDTWAATAKQARETVAITPSLLDVLREAGVVDSGGYGFSVMLEGGLQAMTGSGDGSSVFAAPIPILDGKTVSGQVRQEFVATVTEESWGYCTSFAVEGSSLDIEEIRATVNSMGKSAVVAGDMDAVKVHVHVIDPGQALSYGVSLGAISNVDVKNMDQQTRAWAADRSGHATTTPDPSHGPGAPGNGPLTRPGPVARLAVAIVAVVAGDGLAELYRSTGLGACSVIQGGDSMNPSTAEILRAIEAAPSDSVIVLPNNKNVIGTAKETPGLTDKQVRIVPTRSVQAGISALLAFSPDAPLDENAGHMQEAAGAVVAGAVCKATRSVIMDGHDVEKDSYIGLLDDEIVATGATPLAALLATITGQAAEGDVVTLYSGVDVAETAAAEAAEEVRRLLPGAELELVAGGQPHYEFLISIE
ncbi:MAG: DAK2 domain-containing protein [Dehalococcoidia bacterium]|nr:DAK2 domain-containing protein [Dehalococcoidia bacterium]MSQ35044.1 DAK2 domain-containing protein [Dehalococcoidia bacterium]